jgi:hypothetical protein
MIKKPRNCLKKKPNHKISFIYFNKMILNLLIFFYKVSLKKIILCNLLNIIKKSSNKKNIIKINKNSLIKESFLMLKENPSIRKKPLKLITKNGKNFNKKLKKMLKSNLKLSILNEIFKK